MQRFAGTCSPEQLHTLQRIFDVIWMELQMSTTSNYSGPFDPDTLREEIARRVLGSFDGDGLNADEIATRVLASFGIKTGQLRPYPASL